AALVRGGATPAGILLLTFTRRAASEMIRRASHVVGETVAAGVWGGTFHAVAHRLLRTYAQPLGLSSNFVVMDQGDAEDLLHLIRTDFSLHQATVRFPQKGTLLAIYSRCVNAGESLEKVLAERFPWCQAHRADLARVFQEYGQRKSARHLLDYDDLLLHWDQALELPGVSDGIAGRFQHVLVDEYQDTNPIQAAILQKLWSRMRAAPASRTETDGERPTDCSIMVVGDDAQSIYSFRGATVDNILNFPDHFRDSTTITLDQNYRSVTPILEAANAIMSFAQRRFTKNLWSSRESTQKPALVTCADELEQSKFVVERILERREEGVALTR